MKMPLVLTVLCIGLCIQGAMGIKCYVSNEENPLDTTLKEEDGFKSCQKTTGVVMGMQMVVRGGSEQKMPTMCQDMEMGGMTSTVCFCNSDLCNGAQNIAPEVTTQASTPAGASVITAQAIMSICLPALIIKLGI